MKATWQAYAIVLATIVVSTVLLYFGVAQDVFSHDKFYTASFALLFLYFCLGMSLYNRRWATRGVVICPAIGLLGTVIGFSHLLQSLGGEGQTIASAWPIMHTTGVGIAGFIVCYFMQEALKNE